MKLNELRPPKGAKKKRFKVGRGPGSGNGKTCGKGQKGAGARKSPGQGSAFEGGQMPLQRRLPKVGFHSPFPKIFQIVNIKDLEARCNGEVDGLALVKAGLIKHDNRPIKILGEGELSKALIVKADRFSESARKAIEAAGGKAQSLSSAKAEVK